MKIGKKAGYTSLTKKDKAVWIPDLPQQKYDP